MALNRLSALMVAKLAAAGLYPDGAGLYLQVTCGADGRVRKSWLFRFVSPETRKERQMGLGPLAEVSLAEARQARDKARAQLREGTDPIEARNRSKAGARLLAAKAMIFDQCSAAYIAAHQAGWHNFKHRQQWTHTLRDYASPIFGALPVEAVDTALVMRVLEPIWATKSSTASRVRGRIESILDWAKVRGYREGENPARWKGHLDHLLPARGRVKKALHHAALPYAEVPAFMARLRAEEGVAAKALSFLILTAVRRGEVLGARWGEINLAAKSGRFPLNA
jgi:hypothetical protein